MEKETSKKVFKVYNGSIGINIVTKFYSMPLLIFEVKESIKVSMPLAIDFGTVNTTVVGYEAEKLSNTSYID